MIKALFFSLLLLTVFAQSADDDLIESLIPNYNHAIYSGYLPISLYKNVHYIYCESQGHRENDPLIIWIQGGPGCSSIYGMFYENGPFIFNGRKPNLKINPKAWNRNAGLLYLELPAGVGFSQGLIDNVTISDETTINDFISSLRYFYARFPTMKSNTVYLAGEGYGGILAPYIAMRVEEENKKPFFNKINLKGLLLGNPCTDPTECYSSGAEKNSYYHYEFLYNHAFYTDRQWNEFRANCVLNYNSGPCYTSRQILDGFFNKTNSSYYNIYAPCYKNKISAGGYQSVNMNCEDENGILTYFNDPDVQYEYHVKLPTGKDFEVCNMDVYKKYLSYSNGSLWIYPELLKLKYKLFIYSGDLDSSVPITGTKTWVSRLREELNIPVRKTWREWWVPGKHPYEDQVGGMVWQLEGLTLATVKNAGMMVGRDQNVALGEIVDAFLTGSRLPLTSTMKGKIRA